jgi:hypothetical protein
VERVSELERTRRGKLRAVISRLQPHGGDGAASARLSPARDGLGGHPKPAIDGQLKTGHHTR